MEALWRLAKCCNELANKLESKDERKAKILEGRQYALDAYNVSGGWQTLTWRWRGIPGLAEAFPGREVGCNHDRPTDELRGNQGADRVRSRDEGLSFGLNWREEEGIIKRFCRAIRTRLWRWTRRTTLYYICGVDSPSLSPICPGLRRRWETIDSKCVI